MRWNTDGASAAGLLRTNPVIFVKSANDAANEFIVRPSAAVFNGSDGRIISLSDVPLGSPLHITYDIVDGVQKASGIKLLAVNVESKAVKASSVETHSPITKAAVPHNDDDKDIK